MGNCTLYVVRHGQTDWNVKNMTQGQMDIPLNQKGIEQASALREKIKDIHFDAVFSSDLIRAKRTAEILNLERKLIISTTKALRERAFGTFEGKSLEEMHAALGNLLREYKSHPFLSESKVETDDQLVSRVLTFIREISLIYQGKRVLLVSHGGLMRIILIHLGYCTYDKLLLQGSIQNLAYITLESDGSEVQVKNTFGITLSS